jgi:hypothetical protein
MMRLRFWLRLQPLSFGLYSENLKNLYKIYDFFFIYVLRVGQSIGPGAS